MSGKGVKPMKNIKKEEISHHEEEKKCGDEEGRHVELSREYNNIKGKGRNDDDDNESLASFGDNNDEFDDADDGHTRSIVPSSILPIIPIREGLKKKASPLAISSWVALSLTLDGRDKITKVVQYAGRMLTWWCAGTNHSARFKALYQSVSTSRKAYRLGRSITEIEKIRNLGIAQVLFWHLKNLLLVDSDKEDHQTTKPRLQSRKFVRKASSNIGWGPSTQEEEQSSSRNKSIYRSLSSAIYGTYRSSESKPSSADVPMWKLIGSAMKMIGLMGFWAGDNASFLLGTGVLDNYQLEKSKRVEERNQLKTKSSKFANRFYFFGCVAGLLVTTRSYLSYRQTTIKEAHEALVTATAKGDKAQVSKAQEAFDKAKEKQFSLFLAMLKSCCDVIVFSNNPGIDLWKKYRGKKNHEGVHCVLGLTSAATVLYNNFPNVSK